MTDAPTRPRGRPPTGGAKRFVWLPADLLPRWDAMAPDERKDAIRRALG